MITVEEVKSKTPERFWNKIHFGEISDCWEWQAYKWDTGYGCFMKEDWKSSRAHRYMYEKLNGDTKLLVLHKCDNPSCVNPNHLFVGTFQDNTDDMIAKNRDRKDSPKGSKNGSAKLFEAQAIEIKIRLKNGESLRKLSKEYHVSTHTIRMIGIGRLWKSTCGSENIMKKKVGSALKAKLDEDKVKLIKMKLEIGQSKRQIAKIFGIDPSVIVRINNGTAWKHVI